MPPLFVNKPVLMIMVKIWFLPAPSFRIIQNSISIGISHLIGKKRHEIIQENGNTVNGHRCCVTLWPVILLVKIYWYFTFSFLDNSVNHLAFDQTKRHRQPTKYRFLIHSSRLNPPKGKASEQIRYCSWSSTGNALVFVHECNIFYLRTASLARSAGSEAVQITDNGVLKKVFNGVPDWVYEGKKFPNRNERRKVGEWNYKMNTAWWSNAFVLNFYHFFSHPEYVVHT